VGISLDSLNHVIRIEGAAGELWQRHIIPRTKLANNKYCRQAATAEIIFAFSSVDDSALLFEAEEISELSQVTRHFQ